MAAAAATSGEFDSAFISAAAALTLVSLASFCISPALSVPSSLPSPFLPFSPSLLSYGESLFLPLCPFFCVGVLCLSPRPRYCRRRRRRQSQTSERAKGRGGDWLACFSQFGEDDVRVESRRPRRSRLVSGEPFVRENTRPPPYY